MLPGSITGRVLGICLTAACISRPAPPPAKCKVESFNFRDRAMDEVWQEYRYAVFRVDVAGEPNGTAFLIDNAGAALTAAHVILDKVGLDAFGKPNPA